MSTSLWPYAGLSVAGDGASLAGHMPSLHAYIEALAIEMDRVARYTRSVASIAFALAIEMDPVARYT